MVLIVHRTASGAGSARGVIGVLTACSRPGWYVVIAVAGYAWSMEIYERKWGCAEPGVAPRSVMCVGIATPAAHRDHPARHDDAGDVWRKLLARSL